MFSPKIVSFNSKEKLISIIRSPLKLKRGITLAIKDVLITHSKIEVTSLQTNRQKIEAKFWRNRVGFYGHLGCSLYLAKLGLEGLTSTFTNAIAPFIIGVIALPVGVFHLKLTYQIIKDTNYDIYKILQILGLKPFGRKNS